MRLSHALTEQLTQPQTPVSFATRAEMLGHAASSLHAMQNDRPLIGRYVVIGVPEERGVQANKGHAGAGQGPASFRESFYRLYDSPLREFCERTHRPYAPVEKKAGVQQVWRGSVGDHIVDAGDVRLLGTIEETHEALATCVRDLLERGARRVFVVGGGHDFAYGSYKGHSQACLGLLPLVNLDAHLDLRPIESGVINSGTAFSRILDELGDRVAQGRGLLELGIQRERNPHSLYERAAAHNVPVVEYLPLLALWRRVHDGKECSPLNHVLDHLDDCRELGWVRDDGRVHLSIDLDVFDAALVPGTSASTPFGVSLGELGPVLSYLGRVTQCSVVDFAELCPARDVHNQTARFAAALAYTLILMREEYAPSELRTSSAS